MCSEHCDLTQKKIYPTRWRLIAIHAVRFVQICLCRCHSPIHNVFGVDFPLILPNASSFFFRIWLVLRFDLVSLECFCCCFGLHNAHDHRRMCIWPKMLPSTRVFWRNSRFYELIQSWASSRFLHSVPTEIGIHRWFAIIFDANV